MSVPNSRLQVIGKILNYLRLKQQKTLKEAAKAASISPALMEKIENGQYDFEIRILFDLCHYYGVSYKDVIPPSNNK